MCGHPGFFNKFLQCGLGLSIHNHGGSRPPKCLISWMQAKSPIVEHA